MINEEEIKDKAEETNETVDENIEEVVVEFNSNEDDLLEVNLDKEDLLSEVNYESNEEKQSGSFIKRLLASIIDQVVCVGSSIILLYIVSIILNIFGYRLVDKLSMLVIVYLVFSILYSPILESTKIKNTLGKALLKL